MDHNRASSSSYPQLESLGYRVGLLFVDQSPGYSGSVASDRGGNAMSMTHTVVGGGVLAALAQVLWLSVGPSPAPIQVHSLRYEAGDIIQERTVAMPAVVAEWRAEIVAKSGAVVPNCQGGGFWRYSGGTSSPRFSVQEWVGNPLCDLTPGFYYPRATYSNGSFEVVARGDVFEVTP
jgi:hypothetical protein